MRRLTLLTNPDVCNLRCPLCFLNQRGRGAGLGEMPFEVARAAVEKFAVRDAAGADPLREVIPSTMGEPLLYSKFAELLELCRSHGIPMNLTTNGTFPGRWGSDEGMETLLRACSDIKVSTLPYEVGGLEELEWLRNVEMLLESRRRLEQAGKRAASASLQVTLHRENFEHAGQLLRWAETVGISRVKWNPVVFLKCAPAELRERFALPEGAQEQLRSVLRSEKVRCEGSLYFEGDGSCAVGGSCSQKACPFADEVWVWPDGHEDHCPNPERRWG
jgi:MoaA/NifB/PqqE/SkfB family radical SAM enzyme